MFAYKVPLVDDGEEGLRPDLPVAVAFACISKNGEAAVVVKTDKEVAGLTSLTKEQAEAEVVAMGYDPKMFDVAGLVVKTDG